MSDQNTLMDRRRFLKGIATVAGTAAVGALIEACAPAATSAPTTAPAANTIAPAATSAPAATAAPTAAPTVLKQTGNVKIGLILGYSSVYAALGESITNAMQLYFDSVGGSAGGRKIDLVKEDEENNPQVALRKLSKLLDQDKVDIFSGVISSAVALALRDPLHEAKIPSLVSNAGANDVTRKAKSPYIFRTSFSNWQVSAPMGPYAADKVSKKIVVVAADYAAGHEDANSFMETFKKAGGTVLGEVYPPFPNTDYSPYLPKIKDLKPEAIFAFFSGSDAVNFIKQFSDFGLAKDIKITCPGFLVEQDVLPAQGKAALGAISVLHWAYGLDNAENKKFIADFKAKYNKDADVFAVQGFDTARVIVEAMNAVQGDLSNKQKFLDAIKAVKFNSPRGAFVFDPATQNPIQTMYFREVREVDGKLQNVVIGKTDQPVADPGA